MSTQIGFYHLEGLYTLCLSANYAGYVSPKVDSASLTHLGEADEIVSQVGEVDALRVRKEAIECEFTVIPRGASSTTAKLAATLPTLGTKYDITGLPIIRIGSFTDGWNTNSASTQPWIYLGNGRINPTNEDKWTMTLPMKRFVNITDATPKT